MYSFRLACALVLAASLVVLPVWAAFAALHAASAEASLKGPDASHDDCPCCKPEKVDTCLLKCCHLQALLVRGVEAIKPAPVRFGESAAHRFPALDFGPDPPPPRS